MSTTMSLARKNFGVHATLRSWIASQPTLRQSTPHLHHTSVSTISTESGLAFKPTPLRTPMPAGPYAPTALHTHHAHVPSGPALYRKAYPGRGGQNLSERYHRLERSLRGKEARIREIKDVVESGEEGARVRWEEGGTNERSTNDATTVEGNRMETTNIDVQPTTTSTPHIERFKGLTIPRKPDPPADDECCMSGCAICVYDLYEDSLTAYHDSLAQIRERLIEMGVSGSEWPKEVVVEVGRGAADSNAASTSGGDSSRGTVISAFEELERALQKKKEECERQPEGDGAPPTIRHMPTVTTSSSTSIPPPPMLSLSLLASSPTPS